ncbi:MAG TPA: hypothetical protein PK990_02870 [Salinivirgaceae bacterium]|nr:hypothetical protein [Salinivirgaceae bacterium]
MTKKIFMLAISAMALMASAQDDNKTEKIYTPQTGDFGIGFDGTPYFNYLGNMFNGTTNNTLNPFSNTLYFRYFLEESTALRVLIRINSSINTDLYYVRDDNAFFQNPLSRDQVIDTRKDVNNFYGFRVGMQKFRSKNRFLGFFGADLSYAYQKNKTIHEYGNGMNELNPSPTTYMGTLAVRPLEIIGGTVNHFALGAFTGAEYYFMPGMCIGTEFGLAFTVQFEGQSTQKTERMVLTNHTTEITPLDPGSRRFELESYYPFLHASLYFMVHF